LRRSVSLVQQPHAQLDVLDFNQNKKVATIPG
jgi:hypothetical protein